MTPTQAERVAEEIRQLARDVSDHRKIDLQPLVSALTTADPAPVPDSEAVRLLREVLDAYRAMILQARIDGVDAAVWKRLDDAEATAILYLASVDQPRAEPSSVDGQKGTSNV